MDLTEFLLARIADEAGRVDYIPNWHGTDSARGSGWGNRGQYCELCEHYMFDGTESATKEAWWDHMEDVHRRTFVLAECEAKRRIVEFESNGIAPVIEALRQSLSGRTLVEPAAAPGTTVLRLLAVPYSDHPEYQEVWRP